MATLEAFAAQARTLASTADDTGRRKMLDLLRDLQYSLESPYDTLQRFSGLVSAFLISLPSRKALLVLCITISASDVQFHSIYKSPVLV